MLIVAYTILEFHHHIESWFPPLAPSGCGLKRTEHFAVETTLYTESGKQKSALKIGFGQPSE